VSRLHVVTTKSRGRRGSPGELRDRLRAYVEEKSPHVRRPRRDVRAMVARARLPVVVLVPRRLVVYDVRLMADGNRNNLLVALVAVLALVAVGVGAYIGRMGWQNAMLQADLERLEQKVAALEAAPPPPAPPPAPTARTLSAEDRTAMVDKLKEETGPQKDVWIEWAPNDRESAAYAKALQGAFEEAGWKVKKSAPSPFALKPGIFFLMADPSPPPYVSTALGAFQAAYIQLSSGRDYREFNERKKKEDPNWRGFEMDPDQAYVIGVGPMPKPVAASQ
jgi:hypothetical protein